MDLERGKISVPLWVIFVIFLAIGSALSLYVYYAWDEKETRTISLIGGIAGGLIVSLLTFVMYISIVNRLDFYQSLGVRNLLKNRHEKEYYAKIISGTEDRVFVMGSSCTRFVDDFLDDDMEAAALVLAMRKHKGLIVRLLVPTDQHMTASARPRLAAAVQKLSKLSNDLRTRIELRRFDEIARHSLVIADDDLITGPIFEADKGKYAPAVHVSTETLFGKKYLNYFDEMWNSSAPY